VLNVDHEFVKGGQLFLKIYWNFFSRVILFAGITY